MNGAEHYRAAEEILQNIPAAQTRAEQLGLSSATYRDAVTLALAKAQVHATLAMFDEIREIGDQLDSLPRLRDIAGLLR